VETETSRFAGAARGFAVSAGTAERAGGCAGRRIRSATGGAVVACRRGAENPLNSSGAGVATVTATGFRDAAPAATRGAGKTAINPFDSISSDETACTGGAANDVACNDEVDVPRDGSVASTAARRASGFHVAGRVFDTFLQVIGATNVNTNRHATAPI